MTELTKKQIAKKIYNESYKVKQEAKEPNIVKNRSERYSKNY